MFGSLWDEEDLLERDEDDLENMEVKASKKQARRKSKSSKPSKGVCYCILFTLTHCMIAYIS
jgi:TfoX/Sxy family transcriptional regulator of competence genes